MKDFNETNFNNLEDNQEPKPMDSKMNEQEVEFNVSAAAAEDINSPSEAQAQIEINKTESEQSEDSVYNTSKMDPAYMKETFKPLKIKLKRRTAKRRIRFKLKRGGSDERTDRRKSYVSDANVSKRSVVAKLQRSSV